QCRARRAVPPALTKANFGPLPPRAFACSASASSTSSSSFPWNAERTPLARDSLCSSSFFFSSFILSPWLSFTAQMASPEREAHSYRNWLHFKWSLLLLAAAQIAACNLADRWPGGLCLLPALCTVTITPPSHLSNRSPGHLVT